MPSIAERIAHVETLFTQVEGYVSHAKPGDLIAYLEAVPLAYRSIAYESASMVLGYKALSSGASLNDWQAFAEEVGVTHCFHLDIGLGWAYGRSGGLIPSSHEGPHPPMQWMLWDGVGYYYALYRGRRTLKRQLLPEGLSPTQVKAFDQGVGRRLWYHTKGALPLLCDWVSRFPSDRQKEIWQGIGIAWGYVGGLSVYDLEEALTRAEQGRAGLIRGIALAGISRTYSAAINDDIQRACQHIFGLSPPQILAQAPSLPEDWFLQRASLTPGHFVTSSEQAMP